MQADPRIRRLTESDWRLFAVLRLRALGEALGVDDHQYRQESAFTAGQWRRRLRDHAQFAAMIGQRPVGLIAAQPELVDSVYLYSLWLDPTARNRGLGRALVATAVDWAKRHRARTVWLRVAADNAAAKGIYEAVGFVERSDLGALEKRMELTVR
ncbi:MAG: GNAT family N-acetyltransferase [Mycobacterium sp.]